MTPRASEIATHALRRDAPTYPTRLRALGDAPDEIHVRGTLNPDRPAVAIVGARAATAYGLRVTAQVAGDLARLGCTIVSGLARGIDAAAHGAALDAGGVSVAVIPIGLDRVLPAGHEALAARIAERGAVVTEWCEGRAPFPGMFVRRNRLIAALADATVVVEAAERSGSLSTARVARRLGRALLAVPGDLDRETSRGCHALLADGARVCRSAADVLHAMGVADEPGPARRRRRRAMPAGEAPHGTAATLAGPEARVLATLDADAATVDRIAERAGLSGGETLAALLALEWSRCAEPVAGQRWRRVRP